MEKIRLYKSLERTVAHLEATEAILGDAAFEVLQRARARLAEHRKTGAHKVTQTKGKVDHYVNLEGPAPLAVEEGWHDEDGEFHPGLDILKGAL